MKWPPSKVIYQRQSKLELAASVRIPAAYAFVTEHPMPAGTVRFFNAQRGFGFVAPNDGGEDIFVHISAIERSGLLAVNEGDFLEFDVERDRRTGKFVATNIDLITPASPGK